MDKPLFVLDSSLPYLEGLVEQVADVRRLPNRDFTPETIRGARALLIRSVGHAGRELLEGSGVEIVATATAGSASTPPLTLEGCSSVRNPRKFSLIRHHISVYAGKPLTSGRPTAQNRMYLSGNVETRSKKCIGA